MRERRRKVVRSGIFFRMVNGLISPRARCTDEAAGTRHVLLGIVDFRGTAAPQRRGSRGQPVRGWHTVGAGSMRVGDLDRCGRARFFFSPFLRDFYFLKKYSFFKN